MPLDKEDDRDDEEEEDGNDEEADNSWSHLFCSWLALVII